MSFTFGLRPFVLYMSQYAALAVSVAVIGSVFQALAVSEPFAVCATREPGTPLASVKIASEYWLLDPPSTPPTYTEIDDTFADCAPLTTRDPVMKLESASSRVLPRLVRPSVPLPGTGVLVAVAVGVRV